MIDCLKPEVKPWSLNVNPWFQKSEKVSMAKKSSIWQTIYVVNHKPLFHVQVLETVEFGTHLHCYIIELRSQEVLSGLVSYLPLHMHTFPGKSHICAIVPKHRLLTVD